MSARISAPQCPTCGEDGDHFVGSAAAEVDHYLRRMLWSGHKLRQAIAAFGHSQLAATTSAIIAEVDELADLIREWRRN